MSEENNWNYGNDEPNVNQGNPVSLEKNPLSICAKNIVFREIIKLQNKRLGVRIIPVCYFIEELGVALEDICIISLFTFYKLQFDETEIYGFLG